MLLINACDNINERQFVILIYLEYNSHSNASVSVKRTQRVFIIIITLNKTKPEFKGNRPFSLPTEL